MADENTQSEIIDLGFDVSEADVARPVLKNGTYSASISFARTEQSKNGHKMLLVGYRLAEKAEDTEGKPLNPGFTVNQRILMEPTGNLTQEMINDRIKRIHFAAAGAGRVNTGAWIGKNVRVRVSVREAQGEYPASNDIAAVMPVK